MSELEEFLEKNPHLKLMQKKLEDELRGKSSEERMILLLRRINDNLDELVTELKLLQVIYDRSIVLPNKR